MMQYPRKKDMLVLPEPYPADTNDKRFGQLGSKVLGENMQQRTESALKQKMLLAAAHCLEDVPH